MGWNMGCVIFLMEPFPGTLHLELPIFPLWRWLYLGQHSMGVIIVNWHWCTLRRWMILSRETTYFGGICVVLLPSACLLFYTVQELHSLLEFNSSILTTTRYWQWKYTYIYRNSFVTIFVKWTLGWITMNILKNVLKCSGHSLCCQRCCFLSSSPSLPKVTLQPGLFPQACSCNGEILSLNEAIAEHFCMVGPYL